MERPENVERHGKLCGELNALYERKNNDYGDSFHLSYLEEGLAMARIRLGDKLNRFKTLSRKPGQQKVGDESMRDTLLDLANYALMTVMELDAKQEKYKEIARGLSERLPQHGLPDFSLPLTPEEAEKLFVRNAAEV